MKKIFAIAAMAAMLIACGDNGEQNNPNPNPGTIPGGEVEVTTDITIDGNFEDWNGLEGVSVVTLGTDGTYSDTDLKTLKLYADELSINIYAEYDPTVAMVLCCHMDVDGDANTGRSVPFAGVDIYMEGSIYEWSTNEAGDTFVEQIGGVAWNPGIYEYAGEDGSDAWGWNELLEGGLANGSVPAAVDGGLAAVEVQIMREMIPLALGESVSIMVGITNSGWDQSGILPQISLEAEEAGETPVALTVTLP